MKTRRLTEKQIESLLNDLKDETKSMTRLAKKYNVTRKTIYLYKNKFKNSNKIENIIPRKTEIVKTYLKKYLRIFS